MIYIAYRCPRAGTGGGRGEEDSVDLFLNYFNAHFQGQYVELVLFSFSDFKIFVLFNRVIR